MPLAAVVDGSLITSTSCGVVKQFDALSGLLIR